MNRTTLGYIVMSTLFASAFSFYGVADSSKPGHSKEASSDKKHTKKAIPSTRAFINVDRLVPTNKHMLPKAYDEWRELYSAFLKKFEPVQKEISDAQDQFQKAKTEFENLQKSSLTSKEALQRKYEEVTRLISDIQGRSQQAEMVMQEELDKIRRDVGPTIEMAINEIRVAQGWDIIERADMLISVDKRFDITDDVLEKLNRDYSQKKKSKKDTTDTKGTKASSEDTVSPAA